MSSNFYAGQNDYINQLNLLWDRATTSVFGVSTTSESISLGSKSFTTNTNLQFAVGSQITITATGDLSKYMSGQVTAYTQSTGALDVNITSVNGSGTFSSWSITLSGAAGATGAAGTNGTDGADGIADSLSIGTVTSGTASASITGTSPNKFLNLTLQTGATGSTGATGAPNVLSVGTVTGGVTADATITGTSPSQVLNLTLPQGATGDTGAAGLTARGAWNGATAYVVVPSVDWVTYNGSSYYRKVAGTTATDPTTDTTNWGILAVKGTDGAGSVAGVTASSPLASTGGANPDITIQVANTSQGGYLTNTDWNTFNNKGTVTSASVVSANGFSGSVATATTTPAITVSTSVSGILKGSAGALAAATVGDFPIFNQNTTGTSSNVTGVVAIANGGTGSNTQQLAINALAGAVTSGSYLRGDGTNVLLTAIQAGDIPTLNQNTTGTASNVTGIVLGVNGGTGVSNTGKTITLGGNHVNSGAFASTFTFTGVTTVTFPTSGTLLSTANAVTVAQGGTGLSTIAAGSVLVGAGTSSPTLVAPSTTGNVLTSNGSTWVSSAPTGGGGGLVRLNGSSFTTQTSVAYTTVFNTTAHDTFLLVIDIDAMSSVGINILGQFYNDSSSLINTKYYSRVDRRDTFNTTTFESVSRTNAADFYLGSNSQRGVIELVVAPKKVTNKLYYWKGVTSANGEGDYRETNGTGGVYSSEIVHGIRLAAASGTFSGSIQIYGYAKS